MKSFIRMMLVVLAVALGGAAASPAWAQETYGPASRKVGTTTAPTTNEDFGADTNPLAILGRVGETIEGSRAGGTGAAPATGATKSGLSSSINILVVLAMTVSDKARDVAVLMAMGARRSQVTVLKVGVISFEHER